MIKVEVTVKNKSLVSWIIENNDQKLEGTDGQELQKELMAIAPKGSTVKWAEELNTDDSVTIFGTIEN
jgi:hypothetical protein